MLSAPQVLAVRDRRQADERLARRWRRVRRSLEPQVRLTGWRELQDPKARRRWARRGTREGIEPCCVPAEAEGQGLQLA